MTFFIGIAGRAGSGKNTAAIALQAFHPDFGQAAFADPMKRMAQEAFPELTSEMLWGESEERETLLETRPLRKCPFCGSQVLHHPDKRRGVCMSLHNHVNLPRYLTPRIILQTLGTEWGRRLDPNVWIRATLEAEYDDPFVVITDVRFPNEVEAIRERGGCSVFLQRGWEPRDLQRGPMAALHESECLSPAACDFVFNNAKMSLRDFECEFPIWLVDRLNLTLR